jgi:anti-sigma regulatory factor (Ser/Thr protein kinase)
MTSRTDETLNLETAFKAVPSSAGYARRAVGLLAAGGGACEVDIERVQLAVSEAVTNAIVHGCAGEDSRCVRLTAAVIDEELTVLVADDGCGMGGASESSGLGLGLALIAHTCDSLSLRIGSHGGAQVEMGFHIAARPNDSNALAPAATHGLAITAHPAAAASATADATARAITPTTAAGFEVSRPRPAAVSGPARREACQRGTESRGPLLGACLVA